MRRRLFNLAALVSLVLFAATVVVWVSSRKAYCGVSIVDASKPRDARWIEGVSYRGKFGLVSLRYRAGMTEIESFASEGRHLRARWRDEPPVVASGVVENAEAGRVDWEFAGLSYAHESTGYWCVLVPAWFGVACSAVLPASWLANGSRIRRQRRRNRCATCSYDLTGNVSGVCSECGTAVVGKPEGVA